MKNLNKLIKSGELPRPNRKEENLFDVESLSFEIKCVNYDLYLCTNRVKSSIYTDSHIMLLNDPQHKLLPSGNEQEKQLTLVVERDSTLARMVFHRMENFYKKTK